jgi:hypothetical protein
VTKSKRRLFRPIVKRLGERFYFLNSGVAFGQLKRSSLDGHDTRATQHYLGHRSIASTVRYTALAPDRFKGFWRDKRRFDPNNVLTPGAGTADDAGETPRLN